VAEQFDSFIAHLVYGAFILTFLALMPILTVYVLSFRFRYSQWKGVHFNIRKDFIGAYKVYMAPNLLLGLIIFSFYLPMSHLNSDEAQVQSSEIQSSQIQSSQVQSAQVQSSPIQSPDVLTQESSTPETLEEEHFYFYIPGISLVVLFILLIPYFDYISIRYLASIILFGRSTFSFQAHPLSIYKIYAGVVAIIILMISAWTLQFTDHIDAIGTLILGTILSSLFIMAYLKSQRFNYFMNHTLVDTKHELHAQTQVLPTLWLMVSNSLVIMMTFGFMRPWAKVRTARFFVSQSAVLVEGNLDDFIQQQTAPSSALGEELSDVFDIQFLE